MDAPVDTGGSSLEAAPLWFYGFENRMMQRMDGFESQMFHQFS